MGFTFDEQLKLFVGERHAPNLEKLTKFEFKKHPQFNIKDEWLEPMQMRIQERAKIALNFILVNTRCEWMVIFHGKRQKNLN